jgi:molecular chaperone DnaK
MIFSVKKSIEDLGTEVTAEEKEKVEAATKKLEEALAGSDIEAIKTAKSELEKDAQSIAIKAYEKIQKEQQAKEAGQNAEQNSSNDDNTVNADFEEVK